MLTIAVVFLYESAEFKVVILDPQIPATFSLDSLDGKRSNWRQQEAAILQNRPNQGQQWEVQSGDYHSRHWRKIRYCCRIPSALLERFFVVVCLKLLIIYIYS